MNTFPRSAGKRSSLGRAYGTPVRRTVDTTLHKRFHFLSDRQWCQAGTWFTSPRLCRTASAGGLIYFFIHYGLEGDNLWDAFIMHVYTKASGKSTLSPLHLLDVAMNLSLLFYFILFLILFLLASIKLAVQIKLDFFFSSLAEINKDRCVLVFWFSISAWKQT